MPFVTTYHPAVQDLKKTLMANWSLIINQLLLYTIFKRPPFGKETNSPLGNSDTSLVLFLTRLFHNTEYTKEHSWSREIIITTELLRENHRYKSYLMIMFTQLMHLTVVWSFNHWNPNPLCISQFHLRPAPPPPGYCGAFTRLVSPAGGAFANFALPGGGAFANPRAIPELLTRARFPIRI